MISMIAAVAKNRVIGKDNKLIWHIPGDLKRFKTLTTGHPIIMGRKTFESLPKVLPGRVHYVLTGNQNYAAPDGVLVFHTLDELLAALPAGENFVIGGGRMYEMMLPHADKLYLTEIDKDFDGDAYFPEFDRSEWKVTEDEKVEGELPARFVTYIRK